MKKILSILFLLIASISFAQHKYVIKVKNQGDTGNNTVNPNFNFTVDNSNNDTHLKFKIEAYANYGMTIKWGDGSPDDNFTGNRTYFPDHTYTTAGIYNVTCIISDNYLIKSVNIGIDFSSTCNVPAFRNLNIFTNLIYADIQSTGMKLWTYSDGFPPTLKSSWLTGNNLSPAELDKLLIYFDEQTFNPGAKTLYIQYQETGLGPTSVGLAAIASLESKGWVITK